MGEGAKKLLNSCICQQNHQERHVKRCHRWSVFREVNGPHQAAVVAPRSGEGASVQGDAGERAGLPAPACLYRDLCTTHPAQFRQRPEPWADAVLGRRGGGTGKARLPAPVPAGAEPGPSPIAEARPRRSDMPRAMWSKKRSPGHGNTNAWWILSSRAPLPTKSSTSHPAAEPPPCLPMKQWAAAPQQPGIRAPPWHTHQIAMCNNAQMAACTLACSQQHPWQAFPACSPAARLTPPALGGQGTPGRTPRGATRHYHLLRRDTGGRR